MTPQACRDCGATIRWIRTRAGKAMPVNPVPDKTGNLAATRGSNGRYLDGRVITKADPAAQSETVFRAHWADCPRGEERTPRPAKPEPTQDQLFD